MIERVLLTVLIISAGFAVFSLLRRVHLQRANRAATAGVDGPTLLYFRSDGCATCPTQARYLEQLRHLWPNRFTLRKIDADLETETAVQYGVFTLPTTILLDARGTVRQINYGLTNAQKLARQLEAIGRASCNH